MAQWPAPASAAIVVRRGLSATVHDRRGDDRPRPWASVTKLLVALAVLVAVEEETVALDDPAGPPGATVAHLLAHASGLGLDGPAGRYAPGERRIYSNAGFEVLAAHLEARSGLPFATYLAEAVLGPLAMEGTALAPGSSPAWGAHGPLRDLVALAGELLSPRLVARDTLQRATAVQFPGLDGVLPGFGFLAPCDWGLGFELRDHKSPHWTGTRNAPSTFGHFGQSGGFCWVDPVAGAACVATGDAPFGPWAKVAWPALADAVLDELDQPDQLP